MEGWWWVSFCVCVYVCACTGEWMSKWVSEWVGGWVSEWVSEWWCEWGEWVKVSGWVSEWVSEWVNEWVSEWLSEWGSVCECVSEWVSVCVWVRRRTGGRGGGYRTKNKNPTRQCGELQNMLQPSAAFQELATCYIFRCILHPRTVCDLDAWNVWICKAEDCPSQCTVCTVFAPLHFSHCCGFLDMLRNHSGNDL